MSTVIKRAFFKRAKFGMKILSVEAITKKSTEDGWLCPMND
jgi:hypothetical protein